MTRPGPGLAETLFTEGYRFEFFQAVRLLERIHPDRDPVAHKDVPGDEVVRFHPHLSMAFPASQVYEIVPAGEDATEGSAQPTMRVTFLGLAGASGALPVHYTQLLADPALRRQTTPLRAFLDIFNHRLTSLFYRAWEKYRFPIAWERRRFRPEAAEAAAGTETQPDRVLGRGAPDEDAFSQYLYCLIGLGTPSLQNRHGIADEILLYYAGLISQRPRSATALEGVLQDYFGVNVEVKQFTGEWFLMNADALTRLGPEGQNDRLGVDTVLWERVWDPQARFRIKLGPLSYAQFLDFLPTSAAYRHLRELTRFFVGEEFSFEVQPTLQAKEVPACVLGDSELTRLGWNMWLKTAPFERDTVQPVFEARVAQPVAQGAA